MAKGIVTCTICGAAVLVGDVVDALALHRAWHAGEKPVEKPSARRAAKKVLDTADEPAGFHDWLAVHSRLSGRAVPREGTSYRSELARAFAALQSEGYSAEDFELASEGVVGDEFMRAGGHDKFDNVLRKSKIGGRIDDGKRARAARSSNKYAKFEEG